MRYYIDRTYLINLGTCDAVGKPPLRSTINCFSPGAGARMDRYLRNSVVTYRVMGTLTYPAEIRYDGPRCKRDLDAFGKALKRAIVKDHFLVGVDGRRRQIQRAIPPDKVGDWSLFWFLEYQPKSTGNTHFHFFCTHFLHFEIVRKIWCRVIEARKFGKHVYKKCFAACCKMELVEGGRNGLRKYARKYAKKQEQKDFPFCKCERENYYISARQQQKNYESLSRLLERNIININDCAREYPEKVVAVSLSSPEFVKSHQKFTLNCVKNNPDVFLRLVEPSGGAGCGRGDSRCNCNGFSWVGRFWGVLGGRKTVERCIKIPPAGQTENHEKIKNLQAKLQKKLKFFVATKKMEQKEIGINVYIFKNESAKKEIQKIYDDIAIECETIWIRERLEKMIEKCGMTLLNAHDLLMRDYEIWRYKRQI